MWGAIGLFSLPTSCADTLWSFSPSTYWTAWSGPGPRQGTLHYANVAGSIATLGSPAGGLGVNVSAIVLVFKVIHRLYLAVPAGARDCSLLF